MRSRFGALKTMASLLNLLGRTSLILGIVLGGLFTLIGLGGRGVEGIPGVLVGVVFLLLGVLNYLFFASYGQLILVLLAIEENTRRTAEKLAGENF